MEKREIYLDNSATTRPSEAVLARYLEVSREHFGNPSSLHARGKDAEDVLREAKKTVLDAIGARGGSVVFTASGTEANNLAIFGRARAKARYRRARIVTTAGEHASVSLPFRALGEEGLTVVSVPTRGGALDMDALREALTEDTVLVSVMLVNNETGALYDLAPVREAIRERCPDCVLHADATQAFGKVKVDVRALGVRMLTLSSHKIEGPKGVGALWIDESLKKEKGVAPLILGGGQGEGLRSGTENVPAIAAFATAIAECKQNFDKNAETLWELRAHLLAGLASPALTEVKPILPAVAAPHILSLVLPDIKSEVMLHYLAGEGISVSSGSACSSHGHVGETALSAFGLSDREADCAIRVSLSHRTKKDELDVFLAVLAEGVSRLARRK